MNFHARVLLSAALAFVSVAASAGSGGAPRVLTGSPPEGAERVYAGDTGAGHGAFVENGTGQTFRVGIAANGGIRFEEAPAAPAAARQLGMLPDGEVTVGRRNIAAAWLVGPTDRYAHGVLGDAIEAEGVAAETANGRRLELRLPADSVFEDRYPRLADIDGDGDDEILVVRSYLDRGAALAVIRARPDGLAIVAETPAIGLPNRWLNPIGAADFDGDGRIEIALVETPHIGGTLKIFRWRDGGLRLAAAAPGVSNHAIGSRAFGLSAIIDVDGDGKLDILVPDRTRRKLLAFRFADDRLTPIAEIPHLAPIATDLVLADLDGNGAAEIVYALADGTVVALVMSR